MLRRSTRAATPRLVEDSPVPLTSENRSVGSIRSKNKNTINSIRKGKQRQLDSFVLSDSSFSPASNTSSPAFKGIEIRSEVDSDAEQAPSSGGRSARRSTRTPAPRRSNYSPVPLTSDNNSASSTEDSTQSSASSTTSRLPPRTRPSTMGGGQRGSRNVSHGSMVSDEGTFSRELSVEFVSATYATQLPPHEKQNTSSGSKNISSAAASIKQEMLSRVTKTSNRLIIPDIRPIITSPKRKSIDQGRSSNEYSVDDINVISGQPDWLPSPSPSQRHQEKGEPSNISDSFSLPRTATLDSSNSHFAASSAEASAPSQNETQGQSSFMTARAAETQDHSFAQGNTALTQSSSNRPRPRPRPSAAAIASSHNSPSTSRPFATQPVARPKPRSEPKPMLTQSHQQLSIGNASSSQGSAEEENVVVTGPGMNRESDDGNQPLTMPAEGTSHLGMEREQSPSESIPSNAMREDAEVDDSVPPSTMQLRSREKKRKRSPSVVIIDDSPSPSPPTGMQGKQQNVPKKRVGRPKKANLGQVPDNATQVEPPKRGRGRPKKIPGADSQRATSTKKKTSQRVTRKKPVSLRGKRKTSMLAITESEELFSTAPPPPPRQSPEVPLPIQSSVSTPPRRHRRKSLTPDEEEEEEEEPALFTFADERPEPSTSVSNTSLSQLTFRPTQSQRPKPQAPRIDWDDEPETYFATAPDTHASSLNDLDEHAEEQDVRDDIPSDTEHDRSGSTIMQDLSESDLESENELVNFPGSVAEEQEPESNSDADQIENMLDTAMTEIEEHDKASQSIEPSEEQLSEAVLEQASSRGDTLSDSAHEHSQSTVMQNSSVSYSQDSNSDEVDSSPIVEPAEGQQRARSSSPAPIAHAALYSEELSSSSSPPHSSSPPSSTSSYESALETQRRTQDKDTVQEDTQQQRLVAAQQNEVGQIVQTERSHQLFSIAADGRALRIHVPMAITERDSIVELIRSNGARVCNRVEECDVILIDDELLESENRTVLKVIRDATRQRSQKSIVRRAWLVDSVEVGKALDYSHPKYALSSEQIESVKAKPVARLYNSVPNRSSENLASLRPPPGIGGRVRVDFTEADATQIIGHLAITKKAWDGTLCARELENRFKRHTWMSYQSHIRDNLKKNKHYGDRAQELQIKMGQEKIILERHKMQKELYGSGETSL